MCFPIRNVQILQIPVLCSAFCSVSLFSSPCLTPCLNLFSSCLFFNIVFLFSLILKIYFLGSLSSNAIYNDSLYLKVLFPSFSFLSIPVKLSTFLFPAYFCSKYFFVGINSHAFYISPTIYLSIDR